MFKYISSICVLCLAVFILGGCGTPNSTTNVPKTSLVIVTPPGAGAGAYSATIEPSYIVANSWAGLVSLHSVIAIGTLTATDRIINSAREGTNYSEQSKSFYSMSRVYSFAIEQYLKGSGNGTCNVLVPEAILLPEITALPDAYNRGKALANRITPKNNGRYLLFVDVVKFGADEYCVGNVLPWRFDIGDVNNVIPESEWADAIKYFPPQTLTAAISTIKGLSASTTKPALTATP